VNWAVRQRWLVVPVCIAATLATGFAAAATPDLAGVWQRIDGTPVLTASGSTLPFTPAAAVEFAARKAVAASTLPGSADLSRCVPNGVPELMYRIEPFQLLQSSALMLFVHEANHLPRFVYMNAAHPLEPDPTHLGHSVGRWEGATLVIDTIGFHDKSRSRSLGLPQSNALHVVERLRLRQDGRILEDSMLVEDPNSYLHSWQAVVKFRRRAGQRLAENLCAPHG
jgi:hypothetical protein